MSRTTIQLNERQRRSNTNKCLYCIGFTVEYDLATLYAEWGFPNVRQTTVMPFEFCETCFNMNLCSQFIHHILSVITSPFNAITVKFTGGGGVAYYTTAATTQCQLQLLQQQCQLQRLEYQGQQQLEHTVN